ncbi:MAG TPA: CPBP family glutamic-type intramembrane protease [Anaerolineales bacterium]|jgi:membrane protease YdiL (CAAX protease family)
MHRKQLTIFFIMLAAYALATFIGYAFFLKEMTNIAGITPPTSMGDPLILGLSSAGIVFVLYALFGLAGYWFARKLGLPGIYSQDGNWQRWVLIPLGLGLGCGVILVLGDIFFARINGLGFFPHPTFPASIFASIGAGIGEEIAFRGFVFGLWALIWNWLLSRFQGRMVALWIANIIAALVFGASHLGLIFMITGAKSIADLNPVLLVEVFLLNGVIGLIAGQRYMKDGLVAASGVHFWTDIVFHVLWGAMS